MIIAGQDKQLTSSVIIASTGLPKYDGIIYAIIWLEHDTDGYTGLFWDGSAWETGVQSFPTATHIKAGSWGYTLDASATIDYAGSTIYWIMANSNSEADIITKSDVMECYIREEVPLTESGVWDAYQSAHTDVLTFGAIESNIRGPDNDDLKDVTDKIEAIPSPTEMSFASWGVGENITVKLFVADPITGNGLSGQVDYITLTIQRATDRKYWNGLSWQVASYDLVMTETNISAQPGAYHYILSGSVGNEQQDSYTAYATVNNPGTVTGQNFEIHISRQSVVRIYESEPA